MTAAIKNQKEESYWNDAKKLKGKTLFTTRDKVPFQIIEVSDRSIRFRCRSRSIRPYSKKFILGACRVREKGLEVNTQNLSRAGVTKMKQASSFTYLPAVVEAIFDMGKKKGLVIGKRNNQNTEEDINELYWKAAKTLEGQTLRTPKDKVPFKVNQVSEKSVRIICRTGKKRTYSKTLILGACHVGSQGLEINPKNLMSAGVARKSSSYSYLPAIIGAILTIVNRRDTRPGRGWGGSVNPQRKAEVEERAILETTKWFVKKGYKVTTRENDNLGWDLDACKDGDFLKLEVKGLFNEEIVFGLTPNEYRKLNEFRNDGYRICVVAQALGKPALSIFSYLPKKDVWVDERGKKLNFKPVQSAIVSA